MRLESTGTTKPTPVATPASMPVKAAPAKPASTKPAVVRAPVRADAPSARADVQARQGIRAIARPDAPAPAGTDPRVTPARGQVGDKVGAKVGSKLDRDTPPAERQRLQREQGQLEGRVTDARAKADPHAIDPKFERELAEIGVRADYWKTHDRYVDPSGKVYKAQFDDVLGDLTITRTEVVDNRPSPKEIQDARGGQRQLQRRIDHQVDQLPPQQQTDPKIQQGIEHKAEALYYATHPIKVTPNGETYAATVDPQTGNVAFELQPDELTITETHIIGIDGERTNSYDVDGDLPNGKGSTSSSRIEHLDAKGRIIDGSTTSEHDFFGDNGDSTSRYERTELGRGGRPVSREVRLGNYTEGARSDIETQETFDAKGRIARSVTERHDEVDLPDGADGSLGTTDTTDTTTTLTFDRGVIATSHAESEFSNVSSENSPIHESTTSDVRFDERGRPIHSSTERTTTHQDIVNGETTTDEYVTTLDAGGKPIYDETGAPTTDPVGTLTRTYAKVVEDGGQDDGYDLSQEVVVNATLDAATGEYVFADTATGTTLNAGKDGDITNRFKLHVDPATGATSGEPFDEEEHDDRSGWRQVKDGATTVAKWAGAIAGVGLLAATTVGTGGLGTPAAWAAATAAFNTLVLGSTVFDASTGRNHAGFGDAALAAIGTVPGAAGGAAWAGKQAVTKALARQIPGTLRAERLAAAGARFGATGQALVVPGAVGNATYTGVQLDRIREKVANGEPLDAFDVAALLAAGGRLNFSRGKLNGTY